MGSIIIAGAAGGLIGWSITDLQCTDGCATTAALVGLVLLSGIAGVTRFAFGGLAGGLRGFRRPGRFGRLGGLVSGS